MPQNITEILHDWKEGDTSAVDRLFPFVYDELRRRAQNYLRNERDDHTLQPTALVHEAYIRLIDVENIDWKDRVHFYAVSSNVMRRVLVDHARALKTKKRGGLNHKVPISDLQLASFENASELLSLDDALKNLAKIDERKSRVVEMSYFGGMNQKEIAGFLEVAVKTVQRDLKFAKLWLLRELSETSSD